MKYRKKSIICSLLVGLMVLTSSCHRKPTLQLLATKDFNFPSASAIECYNNSLYVFGDDAAYLLHLTVNYEVLDSAFFWNQVGGRISKNEKHDIESAFIRHHNGQPIIFGVGSMSTENRKKVIAYNVKTGTFRDTSLLTSEIQLPSINAVNLEGSCQVIETIVLANRANLSNPLNHLIFLSANNQPRVSKLLLPKEKMVSGVSGLYYLKEKDLLLFSASEEETGSTVLDGAIGDSYVGWIEDFSKKMSDTEFIPDGFIRLVDHDAVFNKQKIESICVERVEGDSLILHLAADNDNGTSRFFKVLLSFY